MKVGRIQQLSQAPASFTGLEVSRHAVIESADADRARDRQEFREELERAGLTIVDRELHEALVRAVRAVEWERVRTKTLLWAWDAASSRAYPVQRDAMNAEAGVELAALDRAVALLAERGSD